MFCLCQQLLRNKLVLEINISFVLFKGYENGPWSYTAFRQQNAAGCELLFSLRWSDRVVFASKSWFVNKLLTTCIHINQPSSCHMALLSIIFSIFIRKAITHSTEKACWIERLITLTLGQGKISKLQDKLLLGNNEKNLLNLSNWVTQNTNVQNQRRLQTKSLPLSCVYQTFSLSSANLVSVTPYVPTESYYFHIYVSSSPSLWSPALFRGWSCYGLFL